MPREYVFFLVSFSHRGVLSYLHQEAYVFSTVCLTVSRITQNYWPYCVALISSTIIINYIINTFPDYLSIVTSISSMKFLSKPSGLLENMFANIYIYILMKPVIKPLRAWENTLHFFFLFPFSVFPSHIFLKFSTLSRQEVELQYLKTKIELVKLIFFSVQHVFIP